MALALFLAEERRDDLDGAISAHWSAEAGRLLVYAEENWAAPQGFTRHPLSPLMQIHGASKGEVAPFHYVVWTDVTPGWEDELNNWYAQEHLPGLASVPGAVRARRFSQSGEGPRYLAAYDLTAPEVLGSPPWLVVRGTDWSSRVRPEFRNTRRWMCETLFDRSDR